VGNKRLGIPLLAQARTKDNPSFQKHRRLQASENLVLEEHLLTKPLAARISRKSLYKIYL